MAGLHWLTIEANTSNPVQMPTQPFLLVIGTFLVGIGMGITSFLRQFRRPRV